MANECSGVCRVVAKDEEVIKRLEKIMNYDDGEFFVDRCRDFSPTSRLKRVGGGFFARDFETTGAWNCERFFTTPEDKGNLMVIGYETGEHGLEDFDKPIYGTAHLSNLVELAKLLKFGIEMWTSEPGCGFAEHMTLTHEGEYRREVGDYSLSFPDGPDGEPDYDADQEEVCEFDDWGEFSYADEIYGEELEQKETGNLKGDENGKR